MALLVLTEVSLALAPDLELTQYVRASWRMEEGLPHDAVRAVHQTRDGYMWFGTFAGLVRFDGVRFVVYDNQTSNLRHNEIRALAETPDGTLWIGTTAGGLHRFRDGRIEPVDSVSMHRTVNALAVDDNGGLWIGTGEGVHVLRTGEERFYGASQGLPDPFVSALAADGQHLWVGTAAGLFRIDDSGLAPVDLPGLGGQAVNAILRTRDGLLRIGAQRDVLSYRLDPGGIVLLDRVTLEQSWGNPAALLEDSDGSLWIGSYGGGLYRLRGNRLDRMSTEHGFIDHRPWALLEDREGGLWVGTRGGVAYLRDGSAVTVATEEGLPEDIARTVFEDRDGTLWIGTEAGLSEYVDGRLRRYFSRGDGFPLGAVRSILHDPTGRLWLAGDGGLAALEVETGIVTATVGPEQGVASAVRVLAIDPQGRTWAGTEEGLLVSPDLPGVAPFEPFPGLPAIDGDAVEAIEIDRDGGVLVGFRTAGMMRWKDGTVEHESLVAGASVGIRSFHRAEDGTLYIGTMGSGLFVRRPGQPFAAITTREGLPDDAIWSILPDGPRLWMSSDRGVFVVHRDALDAVIDGQADRLLVDHFLGTRDGMKSRECNGGGRPAGVVAADGRRWYPTARGVVAIDPAKLEHTTSPTVVLEEIRVDHHVATLADGLLIPPGGRDVEIDYTGLDFRDPRGLRFRYRLVGYQDDWVEVDGRRQAFFSNLPPGGYRFDVQAALPTGSWSAPGASLVVVREPHAFETQWFRALALATVLVLILAWLRLRSVQQRRLARDLRRLVKTRTRDLEDANAALQTLASCDPLTGLANHRTFFESLGVAWEHARETQDPLVVLLVDVDDFKAYNDAYGHLAGDSALRAVSAEIARLAAQAGGLAARYGGEEFALLLPAQGRQDGGRLADDMRLAVQKLDIEHRSSRTGDRLTICVGVAAAVPDDLPGVPPVRLVERADEALYYAKARGRNGTIVAEPLVLSAAR